MAKMGFGRGNAPGGTRDPAGQENAPTAGERFLLTLVHGTMVATCRGDVAVQDIVPGDGLVTRGAGSVQVLSVVVRPLTREALIAAHRLTPVLVRAGGVGSGVPKGDLRLPPWTQLCADASTGGTAKRRAMDLIGDGTVMRIFPDGVTYVEMTLAAPTDVLVAGLWLTSERGGIPAVPQGPTPGRTRDGWTRIGNITPDWTPTGDAAADGSPQGCRRTQPALCDCDCHKIHHVVHNGRSETISGALYSLI